MKPMNRREAIKQTAVLTVSTLAVAQATATTAQAQPAPAPSGPFTLSKLPYAYDALEPHIDARTMEIHHSKHHNAYVTNLNKAIHGKADLEKTPLPQLLANINSLPQDIRNAVRNNGGGHYNHDLFWKMMSKNGGGEPKGAVKSAIEKQFGTLSKFKEDFSKAALGQFGSGWAWLLWNGSSLEIKGLPNQDAPISAGQTALLGIDVWEHAYYLKYQNRRVDYITAWFNVVNWDFVAERMNSHKA